MDLDSLSENTAVINVDSVAELDALLSGVSGSFSGEDIVPNQSIDSNSSTSKAELAATSTGTVESNLYDAIAWNRSTATSSKITIKHLF
ncbi:hypothetical protein [Paenibacillus sp. RC21]|uniref:hypothetical protein n=1 Tax=Paenibacillus sp. RC21 TaxID=3156312 RepID=UPI003832D7CC